MASSIVSSTTQLNTQLNNVNDNLTEYSTSNNDVISSVINNMIEKISNESPLPSSQTQQRRILIIEIDHPPPLTTNENTNKMTIVKTTVFFILSCALFTFGWCGMFPIANLLPLYATLTIGFTIQFIASVFIFKCLEVVQNPKYRGYRWTYVPMEKEKPKDSV
jgi:hypothetical protein